MNVNDMELFSTLAAGLPGLSPLPDIPELRPDSSLPAVTLGRFEHGQLLSWREVLEVTTLPGFGQRWTLVPLRGGRVALAWREALTARQDELAMAWQARALPVLAALSTDPGNAADA